MLGERKGRSVGLGTTFGLAAALIVTAIAWPAPPVAAQEPPEDAPVDLATTVPVEIPGIDPVLDAVPVESTAAITDADEQLSLAADAQNRAVLRWIQAEQRRRAFASKATTAAQVAADAKAAHEAAKRDLAAKEQELQRRQLIEDELEGKLAVQQEDLRSLAAHLFTTAPEDRYAILGSLADVSAADQRDALRDLGAGFQTERLEAARKPWAEAKDARERQDRSAERASEAVDAAAAEALRTADERDRFDQFVRATEDGVREAVDNLNAARDDSTDALAERRSARLLAPISDLGFPLVALHAYWRASALAPCQVPWWVIAGVGRVETRHGSAFGSDLTAEGDTTVHIIGIPLDGRPGTMAIADTDGGRLDDDPVWDRAVGPMQFIPGTWARWASDGNADEDADPHNIYDAAGAAAQYLCFSRGNLDTEAKIRGALLAYNRSVAYGNEVLSHGHEYQDALDLPDLPPVLAEPSD